jgi:hypothetical protein
MLRRSKRHQAFNRSQHQAFNRSQRHQAFNRRRAGRRNVSSGARNGAHSASSGALRDAEAVKRPPAREQPVQSINARGVQSALGASAAVAVHAWSCEIYLPYD